jgi:hypothetical protein
MKIMKVPFTLASALVLSAGIIAGCGGGGGGQSTGPEAPAAPVFDVQAAVSAMFETAATFEMTGSLSAIQIGSTADEELHETDTFIPGAPADPRVGDFLATELKRTTWNSITTVPRLASETFYYTESPFRLVAREFGNSSIERYTRIGDFPTNALIGQSGQFATSTFDQSTITDFLFWSVTAAEVPETAWVCLGFFSTHQGISQSQCVRVGANGAILGARVVTDSGGFIFPTTDLRSPLPSR